MNKISTQNFLIDSIGKLFGLIGGLCLTLSLVYDWGFFNAANLNFKDIPSSLLDHLRSSINWLPDIVLGIGVILIIELTLKRIEHGMTEEELIQRSENPEKTRKFRNSPHKLMPVVIILIIVFYVLFGEGFNNSIKIPLIFCWIIFAAWANNHHRIQERRSLVFRIIIFFLPPIMMILFFMGQNSFDNITTSKPQNTLYLSGSPEVSIHIGILKNLEKGILIYEHKSKTIQFIEWSNVKKIERPYKKKHFRGLLSRYVPIIDAVYDNLEKDATLTNKKD